MKSCMFCKPYSSTLLCIVHLETPNISPILIQLNPNSRNSSNISAGMLKRGLPEVSFSSFPGHIVKHGLDWICKTRTGFVKHGFVKRGFVKHGFVKRGFVKGGLSLSIICKVYHCLTVYLFISVCPCLILILLLYIIFILCYRFTFK